MAASRPPVPLLAGLLLSLLALVPPSGCGDDSGPNPLPPGCPQQVVIGQTCEKEGLVCPPTGAVCESSRCSCENSVGAFRWSCKTATCSCVCPCGKLAINSCEALGCTKAPDQCPAGAADVCALTCAIRDLGSDGAPDAGVDASSDSAADLPADSAADLPADSAADLASDVGADAALDGAIDGAGDRGPDHATGDQGAAGDAAVKG